jgi:hypothetical protein
MRGAAAVAALAAAGPPVEAKSGGRCECLGECGKSVDAWGYYWCSVDESCKDHEEVYYCWHCWSRPTWYWSYCEPHGEVRSVVQQRIAEAGKSVFNLAFILLVAFPVRRWLFRLLASPLLGRLRDIWVFLMLICVFMLYDAKVFLEAGSQSGWFTETGPTRSGCAREVLPEWLRVLSLTTWAGVVLAVCFTVSTVWRHTREVPGQLDSARLYTLDVVTLPLVAALMSVRSVTRLLLVSLGNFADPDKSCEANRQYNFQMVRANDSVVLLYTAAAIQSFGHICMMVVQQRARNMSSDPDSLALLLKPLTRITVQGIDTYVAVAYLCAAYELASAFGALYAVPALATLEENHVAYESFMAGLDFLACSSAIWNLMIFERDLGALIDDIRPKTKFMLTKILVTLRFFQGGFIAVFGPAMELQRRLFAAALLCVEMGFIGAAYSAVWVPNDAWYAEISDAGGGARNKRVEMSGISSDPARRLL